MFIQLIITQYHSHAKFLFHNGCVCVCNSRGHLQTLAFFLSLHHLAMKVWTTPDKIRAMRTKPLGLCGQGKIGQLRWQRQQEMAPFETGKGREECLSKDTERIVTST